MDKPAKTLNKGKRTGRRVPGKSGFLPQLVLNNLSDSAVKNAISLLITLTLSPALFISTGCNENQQNGAEAPEKPPEEEHEPKEEIELLPVDAEKYHQIIDQHRNDIVVVDFWATWCPPCVESFPKLVDLHSTYSDKGVTVIAASADFPGEEDSVKDFLVEQEAYFTNLIIRADNTDEFISEVGSSWRGDLPAVLIYDSSGNLIAEHVGSGAVKEAETLIREMLDENGSKISN